MGRGMTTADLLHMITTDGLENALYRYYSFYAADVTDASDNQQQGRVTVQVGGVGMQDSHPSPAWPISPYAGENYGFFFPPHGGERVLCSFKHGSPHEAWTVGSWWGNTDAGHKPETSEVPTEFVDTQGGAPTRRGIKTKHGHGLLFEDEESKAYVELWTGENQEVSEIAKRRHRLLMRDADEEIVLATFGVGEEDAEWDERRHHSLTMRDKEAERWIELKTIGEEGEEGEDAKYHQLLMSDKDKKFRATSTQEHYWEIDDQGEKITCSTKDGFFWELNQKTKKITIQTKEGRTLIFDDQQLSNTLQTPDNQSIKQDATGTTISDQKGDIALDALGNFNVTAKGGSVQTVTGAVNFNFDTTWVTRVTAACQILVGGALQLTAASVTITGGDITLAGGSIKLGLGTLQALLNETGMATYNSHGHVVVSLIPGFAVATGSQMAKGNDTTAVTTAG